MEHLAVWCVARYVQNTSGRPLDFLKCKGEKNNHLSGLPLSLSLSLAFMYHIFMPQGEIQ